MGSAMLAVVLSAFLLAVPTIQAASVDKDFIVTLVPGPPTEASGYVRLTTYTNQTANVLVSLNNIMNVNQAHIHIAVGSGSTSGPVPVGAYAVWILPFTNDPNQQAAIGTDVHPEVKPLSGSFSWTQTFDATALDSSRFKGWSDFTSALATPKKLYFVVHTTQNPGGEVYGYFNQPDNYAS